MYVLYNYVFHVQLFCKDESITLGFDYLSTQTFLAESWHAVNLALQPRRELYELHGAVIGTTQLWSCISFRRNTIPHAGIDYLESAGLSFRQPCSIRALSLFLRLEWTEG